MLKGDIMKQKSMVGFLVLMLLPMVGNAGTVSLGLGSLPGIFEYVSRDALTGNQTQKDEKSSSGAIYLAYSHESVLTKDLYSVLTVGVGLPTGSYVFKESSRNTNVAAFLATFSIVADNNDLDVGDQTEFKVTQIHTLVGAGYRMALGNNTLSVTLQAGVVTAFVNMENTSVTWEPILGLIKERTTVDNQWFTVPMFALVLTPSYEIVVANDLKLSFGLSLASLSKAGLADTRTEHLPLIPPPSLLSVRNEGFELGGVSIGIRVGVSKAL